METNELKIGLASKLEHSSCAHDKSYTLSAQPRNFFVFVKKFKFLSFVVAENNVLLVVNIFIQFRYI